MLQSDFAVLVVDPRLRKKQSQYREISEETTGSKRERERDVQACCAIPDQVRRYTPQRSGFRRPDGQPYALSRSMADIRRVG